MGIKKELLDKLNRVLSVFGFEVVRSGSTMSSTLRWLRDKVALDHVIDIGASDGQWTKRNIKVFDNASFLMVDPLVENEPRLSRLSKNPMINYALIALGSKEGIATFKVTEDLVGSGLNEVGDTYQTRDILIDTLENITKGLEGRIFLKLDTHGVENEILKGGQGMLTRVDAILVETYNFRLSESSWRFDELMNFLEQEGFTLARVCDVLNRPLDGQFWQFDLLFVRANLLSSSNSYK